MAEMKMAVLAMQLCNGKRWMFNIHMEIVDSSLVMMVMRSKEIPLVHLLTVDVICATPAGRSTSQL